MFDHEKNLIPQKRLARIRQASKLYPAFPESSLRWLIFNADKNGFITCIKRVGRIVLLDLDEFENWISSQGVSK